MVNVQSQAGEAVMGGTLTYGVQLLPTSLDPAKTGARDDAGGALAAVYDVLMSYDTGTGGFEPKLAQSLDTNDGGTTWTLKLRSDVKFSDGTPLDADAVIASINRYNEGKGNGAELWLDSVASIESADASTVVFLLNAPWQRFPSMLALGHGMIVAPAAGGGDTFTAIGAGPFIDEKFSPNEERVFKANTTYYGGQVNLDQLRMVPLNGPQANLESLEAGQLDIAYIRGNSSAINTAKEKGYPGYISVLNTGGAEIINNREGRPGSDVRVRQAIAYALDPELIDQRAENGEGLPGSELFGPTSLWHTDTPGVAYDPAKATELVTQAKADGFSGTLDYVVLSEPKDQAGGLAVQSLLQAVGFEVNIIPVNNVVDLGMKVYVKHDFDLSHSGMGLYEAIPDLGLYSTVNSQSRSNTAGYVNPDMDKLLLDLQHAKDGKASEEVLSEIQTLWNETVPSAPISGLPSFWAWQKNVHNIVPTAAGIMLFDQAWIEAK
ncbi:MULTISPECIES: ABC transporter substrate-binding protein [unclassified Rhodococcus (in: high G+C Gram-positive bacteria)]|uniref:ABC transporter substrate-binding protein n=1 Tax=unclassified Rhodococcus (in: high G+C Gram-positive bacteria) TaxID=192944 RepID=UPI001FFAB980|nr:MULTISPECIES: ABC transporter substrate-binding protein [unclassified Rhodococcus (in: high G+C Gram-positive bacteria)]